MKTLYILPLCLAALLGCEPLEPEEEEEIEDPRAHQTMMEQCGQQLGGDDAQMALGGGVIYAGKQIEGGLSTYDLLVNQILHMLIGGITWSALDDSEVDFERGHYVFKTGRSSLGFKIFFEDDFEDFAAGDINTHNLFDLDSYFKNIRVSVGGSLLNPRIEYKYDKGPLFNLINSDIKFSGESISSLDVKFKIQASLLSISIDSNERKKYTLLYWFFGLPLTIDFDINEVIHSNNVPVNDIKDQLEGDGFMMSYSGSSYIITFNFIKEKISETKTEFETAEFALLKDEDGGYWEGSYKGKQNVRYYVTYNFEGTLYSDGFLSNRAQNYTEYYCDADRENEWGTAMHNLDLSGGVVTLRDGRKIEYGLSPVEEEE